MKKLVICCLLSLLVLAIYSVNEKTETAQSLGNHLFTISNGPSSITANQDFADRVQNPGRNETIFYQQGFDDGWEGWETLDLTTPAHMWHLTNWNSFGGDGYSWWVGDPELGGYINRQYLVLDTPGITVTVANSTLIFKLNYSTEPLGSSPNFPEYNGWDGCNVRISTDSGETWNVISGSPAYNSSSMFSFGYIHNEGPDVPGWGGTSEGWIDASFDLSSYVGQEVMIRFAFASDGGLDVNTNPNWFGMMVDNISLGSYVHNFDDGNEQNMSYSSMVQLGGDLWHIATTTPLPPSPPYAAVCQNGEGGYNPGMLNYLLSPPITLPESGEIRVDFMIRGNIDSVQNDFPDTDYWGWQISPDDGDNWYAMSNPYNNPDLSNYVYLTPDDTWGSVTAIYQGVDGYISDYAGETVRFRVFLRTNQNNPIGEGIMIDNYTIYHSEYLPPPTNLTAEIENYEVILNWSAPGGGGSEGWIHWDDGINNDGIGLQNGGSMDLAAKFTPNDLEPYFNGFLTTIRIFPREITSIDLKVWTGPSGTQLIHSQPVTATPNQWNEISLDEPVLINMGVDYWIGYTIEHEPGQWPAGCDAGPHIPGRGDMIRTGANWSSLYDASGGTISVNWNIQALVEIIDEREGTELSNLSNRYPLMISREREVTGYNIYHSTVSGSGYQLITTTTDTNYIDNNPSLGFLNYYVVTAIYGTSESGFSNEASAFVIPETATEFAYDDGVAESGYNAGVNNHIAVKFIPGLDGQVQLTHLKIYVHTLRTGAMVIKIWDDDNGVPGNLLSQFVYPAVQVREGWNIIAIPPANPIYLTHGYFFAGIQESATASAIGVDENNHHSSYTKIGANPWAQFVNGNFMVRAILDGPTSVEHEISPVISRMSLTNFPNPFNPETTILFDLPQDSPVTLRIYNLKGQLVATLIEDILPSGNHSLTWSGKDHRNNDVASGIYLYRLESEHDVLTRRMLLLK